MFPTVIFNDMALPFVMSQHAEMWMFQNQIPHMYLQLGRMKDQLKQLLVYVHLRLCTVNDDACRAL